MALTDEQRTALVEIDCFDSSYKVDTTSPSGGKMLNSRSRLILAVITVLAVAFALCDFGVERYSPQQAIRIAPTENRDRPTARYPTPVREGGSTDLQSTRRAVRAVQQWGLDKIWRVKHRLGM